MSGTKLATKDARMNKSQSPFPRKSKSVEGHEGFKSIGTTELSQCCTHKGGIGRETSWHSVLRDFEHP